MITWHWLTSYLQESCSNQARMIPSGAWGLRRNGLVRLVIVRMLK
jgi:hypothetical protein